MAAYFGSTQDERIEVKKEKNDSFEVYLDGKLTQQNLDSEAVIRYLLHVIPYVCKSGS